MDSPINTKDSLEYFVTYDLSPWISHWIYTEFKGHLQDPSPGSTISQYHFDLDLRPLKILSFDEFFLVLRIEVVDQSQQQLRELQLQQSKQATTKYTDEVCDVTKVS